jgi:hypothetical protein
MALRVASLGGLAMAFSYLAVLSGLAGGPGGCVPGGAGVAEVRGSAMGSNHS